MARGKDTYSLTKDDLEGSFKHAPAGKYFIRFTKDSKVTRNKKGDGNVAKLKIVITKGEHKGITFFDNIATHVGWKIGQILAALKIKGKMKGTLAELVKLVTNQECRATLRVKKFEGKKRNEVVQYLPLKVTAAEAADRDDEDEEEDEDDEDLDEAVDSDDEEDAEDEDEDDEEDADDDEEDEEDDDEDDSEEDSEDEEETDEEAEADDEDEDEDEDDDEEEEAPPRKRVKKAAVKKSTKKK